jgi:hypothetical protein
MEGYTGEVMRMTRGLSAPVFLGLEAGQEAAQVSNGAWRGM